MDYKPSDETETVIVNCGWSFVRVIICSLYRIVILKQKRSHPQVKDPVVQV